MKHRLLIIAMFSTVFLLALSACAGNTGELPEDLSAEGGSSSGESGSGSASQEGPGENFQDDVPISTKLGFGTLMLEGSANAVDPGQAQQLLPLWKAARSLGESDTVAAAEMEALFTQIEDTMTSEQLASISELQLNGEEMIQRMEELGISIGGGGFGNLTSEMQATAEAARESGGGFPGAGIPGTGPGGGVPGGGFGGGQGPGGQGFPGGNLTPEQQATAEVLREERGGGQFRFAMVFIDPLIELLEERAAQ